MPTVIFSYAKLFAHAHLYLAAIFVVRTYQDTLVSNLNDAGLLICEVSS